MGLNVKLIENAVDANGQKDEVFQDLVLTVHHCYMHTLMNTAAYKVIENHLGTGMSKFQMPSQTQKPNQAQADF